MQELLEYYCSYNLWANTKFAHFFSNTSENVLTRTVESSFPSIRETLTHIMNAERGWLNRLAQDTTHNAPTTTDFSSTAEVMESLLLTSHAFLDFVMAQDEGFLNNEITYTASDGVSWTMSPKVMVHHCMNHSTLHRGQLITMARQLGLRDDIPGTDLLFFSREESTKL